MIEYVVALLMFVNGEIKEHLIQENMAACLRGKRHAEREYSESISYKCYKGNAKTEIYKHIEKPMKYCQFGEFQRCLNSFLHIKPMEFHQF